MIPKIIHYCWFGENEKSEAIKECINSWKKYMPDYQIIEWNESNFDININSFVKEAHNQKKWAFITDFVRLWILYNYGGIYMDTDVEVFKPLDIFLKHKAFTSFENNGYPITALIGSQKENPIIKKLLDYYIDKEFEFKGYGNTETNTEIISKILSENGIDRWKHEYQETEDITIYPKEYFCADFWNNKITENTYAIHKMFGSWG